MPTTEINYILATALVLLLPSVAIACTCGGSAPCEAYAGASVVFVGRVTKTGLKTISRSFPANAISTTLTSGEVNSAQFKVEEAFLGVRVARIEISGEGTTCDYPFESGERYLVFAYKGAKSGTFQTYHLVAALTDSRGRLISSKPLVLNVEKDNRPVKLIVESPWKHKRHE